MGRHSHADVERFVFDHLVDRPTQVAQAVAKHFKITRQAANAHLGKMVEAGLITGMGNTRHKTYFARVTPVVNTTINVSPRFEEDRIWMDAAQRLPADLPENAKNILFHAATEMLNNANDHSEGTSVILVVTTTPAEVRVHIMDDGVGVFAKVARECQLTDERQAILELSKGKLTTAAAKHAGEGIFFTSRACDSFILTSGKLALVCQHGTDFLIEAPENDSKGTEVTFAVRRSTTRTMSKVYNEYTSSADSGTGFSRTKVPLSLALFGSDQLVSRSQAKRVMARVDRFKEVILDFHGVPAIGQAFADEVFRVFCNVHPDVKLVPIRASKPVINMIRRAGFAV